MTRPDFPSEALPTAADLDDRTLLAHYRVGTGDSCTRNPGFTYHPGADSFVGVPGCEERADGERIPSELGGGGEEKRAPLAKDWREGISIVLEVCETGEEPFIAVGVLSSGDIPGMPSKSIV